jgi:hypothetical protein
MEKKYIKTFESYITKEEIISAIENLLKEERDFLVNFGDESVLRKMLSSTEIKTCNKLVKKGVMEKGMFDGSEGRSTVIYYVDSFVRKRL